MKHLINKGLLLVSAFVMIYAHNTATDTRIIIALLLSLIAGAVYPALAGISAVNRATTKGAENHSRIYPYICEALVCAYLVSAFWLHPVYMFVPIVSYDMYRYRQRLSPVILVLLSIYMCVNYPLMSVLPQICLIAFSFAMSVYCCRINLLRAELLAMRDNTAEHDMLVAQNTRQLLENQDNMVLTATLSERNRIAREIHDNVGHMLTRSILQTGAIKVINKDERLEKPLAQLQSTLDTAMDSMRKSVHDLYDESVDLRQALAKLKPTDSAFAFSLEYDCEDDVPRDVKYAFIAIAKEAVNNAVKHSNGDEIRIIVREHPAFYQLEIMDNGTSVDERSLSGETGDGIGIKNIKERVAAIGGIMRIKADDGFRIFVTLMKKKGTGHENSNNR